MLSVQHLEPPKCPYYSLLGLQVEERQVNSDSDSNNHEHQPKRARLTRQNLALFNDMMKHEGKKVSAGGPSDAMTKLSTKTTSTTTSGFVIRARRNGILGRAHSKRPKNLKSTVERLARSRETASPPESAYRSYVNNVSKACNEATMVFEVGHKLLKDYDDDEGYQRAFNQAFTGFPKDVGFNNGLSAPQPDFVEGLEMEEFDPVPVETHLDGAVLFKDDLYSIAIPHLAGEWKGRGKDMEEAGLQAAYDGAALVYARNQALSSVGKPDPAGNAEVTTFTTDGTHINFFAHYATSSDGTVKYHQYPVTSTNLKNSYEEYKRGRRQLRNVQDHAKKQSHAVRDQVKEHWKHLRGDPRPIAETATCEERNAYEDKAGCEMVEQHCQPTSTASSESRKVPSSPASAKSLPPVDDTVPGSAQQK